MTADRAGWQRVKRKTIEVYRIAFSYRGAQCRETIILPHTKANDKYVERLRAEVLGKIARNDFRYGEYFPKSSRAVDFGRGPSGNAKLGALLDAWIERNKATLEPSTWIGYHNAVKFKLKPFFGDMRPASVRPSVIREWVGLQTSGLKTIANVLLPLRAVFDELVEDEIVAGNPLRAIKLAKMVPPARRTSQYAADPFTWAELTAALLALAPGDRAPFLFWAHTGVRSGELIGLRWKRVDLAAGTVSIQETTTIGKDKERPKTRAGVRTFALTPAAHQALMKAMLAPPCGDDDGDDGTEDRVFQRATSRMPGYAWGYNTLNAVWKAACVKAGVRYRNTYQLRHTFASQLLMDGRPALEVASLLGHKNTEMVTRVYGKWMGGQPARIAKWGSMLLEPSAAAWMAAT